MRPMFVSVGAALLVLGSAMIAVGPFVVSTGFSREELSYIQTSANGVNQSTLYSMYNQIANQGELIVLTGALLAPVGAWLMAYGLTSRKPEAPSSQPAPAPITA
jgi:hypothetical protein